MFYKLIKTMLYSFPLFSILIIPNISYADLLAKDLLDHCQTKLKLEESKFAQPITNMDTFKAGTCTGYIKGFDDMGVIYASILTDTAKEKNINKYSLYCLPAGVTNTQMAKVIVTYIKSHPAEQNETGDLVVLKAFRAAYPCPK